MTVFFPQGIGQVAEVLISIKRLQVINTFLLDSFTSQIQLCSHLCRYEGQESGTYNVCILPISFKTLHIHISHSRSLEICSIF